MKGLFAVGLLALVAAAGAAADDQPGDKKPPQRPGAGAGRGKFGPGASGGGGMMLMQLFLRADANKDGKISLDEFKAAAAKAPGGRLKDNAEKIFKRIDTDGDGFVTREELRKMQQRMQARGGAGGLPGKPGEKKPAKKENK